jgi:hypothetical protein
MENTVSKDASPRDHLRPAITEKPCDEKNVSNDFRDQKTTGIPGVPRLLKLSVDMLRSQNSAASPGQKAAYHIVHSKIPHCSRCRKAGFVDSADPRDVAIAALLAIQEHDPLLRPAERESIQCAITILNHSIRREKIRDAIKKDLDSITLKKPEGNKPTITDVRDF